MAVSTSPKGQSGGRSETLCRDCDRKENYLDAEPVLRDEMRLISKARREQEITGQKGSWEEAFDLADPAFYGLMKMYQKLRCSVPEIGVPLTDANGVVLEAELALAWIERRSGVVATPEEKSTAEAQGWDVKTLAEAMADVREDGG